LINITKHYAYEPSDPTFYSTFLQWEKQVFRLCTQPLVLLQLRS